MNRHQKWSKSEFKLQAYNWTEGAFCPFPDDANVRQLPNKRKERNEITGLDWTALAVVKHVRLGASVDRTTVEESAPCLALHLGRRKRQTCLDCLGASYVRGTKRKAKGRLGDRRSFILPRNVPST